MYDRVYNRNNTTGKRMFYLVNAQNMNLELHLCRCQTHHVLLQTDILENLKKCKTFEEIVSNAKQFAGQAFMFVTFDVFR